MQINIEFCELFKLQIRRRVKQVPLAFYKTTPTSLFSDSDFAGWTFICDKTEENSNGNQEKNFADMSEENGHISAKRQRIECS